MSIKKANKISELKPNRMEQKELMGKVFKNFKVLQIGFIPEGIEYHEIDVNTYIIPKPTPHGGNVNFVLLEHIQTNSKKLMPMTEFLVYIGESSS